MDPERAEGTRPAGLWLLTLVLLTSPAIHALALLFHARWLNFGSHHPWDAFVYFVIAPVVGLLMLRRHERARFSVYIFLSCEILCAIAFFPSFWVSWRLARSSVHSFQRHARSIRRSIRAGDGAGAPQAAHALRPCRSP